MKHTNTEQTHLQGWDRCRPQAPGLGPFAWYLWDPPRQTIFSPSSPPTDPTQLCLLHASWAGPLKGKAPEACWGPPVSLPRTRARVTRHATSSVWNRQAGLACRKVTLPGTELAWGQHAPMSYALTSLYTVWSASELGKEMEGLHLFSVSH